MKMMRATQNLVHQDIALIIKLGTTWILRSAYVHGQDTKAGHFGVTVKSLEEILQTRKSVCVVFESDETAAMFMKEHLESERIASLWKMCTALEGNTFFTTVPRLLSVFRHELQDFSPPRKWTLDWMVNELMCQPHCRINRGNPGDTADWLLQMLATEVIRDKPLDLQFRSYRDVHDALQLLSLARGVDWPADQTYSMELTKHKRFKIHPDIELKAVLLRVPGRIGVTFDRFAVGLNQDGKTYNSLSLSAKRSKVIEAILWDVSGRSSGRSTYSKEFFPLCTQRALPLDVAIAGGSQ